MHVWSGGRCVRVGKKVVEGRQAGGRQRGRRVPLVQELGGVQCGKRQFGPVGQQCRAPTRGTASMLMVWVVRWREWRAVAVEGGGCSVTRQKVAGSGPGETRNGNNEPRQQVNQALEGTEGTGGEGSKVGGRA